MGKETLLFLFISSLFSCYFFDSTSDTFVARCHNSTLTYGDIKHLIPPNLEKHDSINFVHAIRENWVKEQLLLHQAKLNLSLAQQDVKTQVVSYENALLIHAYQKELVQQKLDTVVSQQEVQQYFEKNKSNFLLNEDIVSLNYIKLKKEVPYLWKLRSLHTKTDEESKVSLEDYCYQFAQDYFLQDNWQYMSDVFLSLPSDISIDSHKLYQGKSLEFSDNNFHYFIFIKKYRQKGNVSPLSMIQHQIRTIIINKRKIDFLKNVENDLYQTALSKNSISYEKE